MERVLKGCAPAAAGAGLEEVATLPSILISLSISSYPISYPGTNQPNTKISCPARKSSYFIHMFVGLWGWFFFAHTLTFLFPSCCLKSRGGSGKSHPSGFASISLFPFFSTQQMFHTSVSLDKGGLFLLEKKHSEGKFAPAALSPNSSAPPHLLLHPQLKHMCIRRAKACGSSGPSLHDGLPPSAPHP